AVEAFSVAADPTAFPEQLRDLTPWQARRIVHNVGRGPANPPGGVPVAGLPGDVPDGPGVVKVDVGGPDPVPGQSFGSHPRRGRGGGGWGRWPYGAGGCTRRRASISADRR